MHKFSGIDKHNTGRPTRYNQNMCEKITAAMANGLSAEAAAAQIGISARSLFYWQKEHKEFAEAIEEGRMHALLFWEQCAMEIAKGKPGNAAIISLGLRNRSRAASGWHEASRLEHSGPDGIPVQMSSAIVIDAKTLNQDQRNSLRAVLMAAKTAALT